ncbi:dihydroneopterin aldolase [Candidatus Kryptobacter tengchongensis]|uniref:7,8-dihydroneopterin aldolase n=1 Tax=Kryptobacter tengchongensis TaxID=1643429 RepID=A0A656D1S6_KRYT1|nr:dihydroneopterin aldolase [Candidatus Kryptobacter tengchongensis]CUS89926.1 dihydroneopterin aldolase [Candidatus Kryptobacter tengchongensis]CUS97227.1 dihydroneopterin aldolase [Candidatus Kryptobacter tengchongensis]CUS98132.1 dihydroneopterin aldolase [Candidatus Kryptobacter tengchongensis]CUU09750.1 dihydroneopterin aldolase [Candidatus Kryptobacter tengchongensis]CUU10017.1 dihydroneopterin aldolase [Candidatus Kryptobacter tengchongensis]
MSTIGIIRIKNAIFYGYHGVHSSEQNSGGRFEVDVELHCDISEATVTDSLNSTIDYEQVYNFLKNLITERKFYLIESLASKIAQGLIEKFDKVQKVIVKVRKPSPPVGGVVDCVEVELEVKKD